VFIACCVQVDILLNNAGLALGTAKVHENSIEVKQTLVLCSAAGFY